jgi:hypothetical protein
MCNRFVQSNRVVKPGERAWVKLRGPAGEFEVLFEAAVFGGPARRESRNYWLKRERAEPVLVPDISAFGEQHEVTGAQGWEVLPLGSALEGFLLPQPVGKDYRLLKIVTQPATREQYVRLGNDRAPVVQLGTGPMGSAPPDDPAKQNQQMELNGLSTEPVRLASPPCAMPEID